MAFTYYRSITVDYTKVSGTQTNFPLLLSFTNNDLRTIGNGGHVQNSNGYDICVFSDSSLTTPLSWEIERYNPVTGEVIFWVKIPSLSNSINTIFYIAYGDSSISTFQSTASNVWDSNYKGVYHLGNGTALNANDSTSGGLGNGTLVNTPTAGAGVIDGDGVFVAASSQYIDLNNPNTHYPNFTFEAWANQDTLVAGVQQIINKGYDGTAGNMEGRLALEQTGKVRFAGFTGGAYRGVVSTATLVADTWYHLVGVHDGTNWTLYINGSSDSTSAAGGITQNTTSDWAISADITIGSGILEYFDGRLDEIRISNSVRSANWILTEYNNQNSPSTFFSLGSEIPISGGYGEEQQMDMRMKLHYFYE